MPCMCDLHKDQPQDFGTVHFLFKVRINIIHKLLQGTSVTSYLSSIIWNNDSNNSHNP